MREKILIMVVVGLLVNLCALNVYAQEEESQSQLFRIHEDVVKPSMVGKYENAAKELKASLTTHGITSVSYLTANTDDFHFMYVTEIANMAALDQDPFSDLAKKMGEEAMQAMWANFADCYDSHKNFIASLQMDLSYDPGTSEEDMNFRHWDWYYIYPDKGQEARAIAKEWHDLYTKNNIPTGYRIYTGGLGTEAPLYIVVQSAKNAADFESKNAKVNELLGEEAQELMQRTMAITRKFETKTGWMRPDLSYMPSEEMTAKE